MRFNQKFLRRLITLIKLTKGLEKEMWKGGGDGVPCGVKKRKVKIQNRRRKGRENLTKKNEDHTVRGGKKVEQKMSLMKLLLK